MDGSDWFFFLLPRFLCIILSFADADLIFSSASFVIVSTPSQIVTPEPRTAMAPPTQSQLLPMSFANDVLVILFNFLPAIKVYRNPQIKLDIVLELL